MTKPINPVNRRRFLQTAAALAAVNVMPARAVVGAPQSKSGSDELAGLDALGQAELVRQNKISPLELVEAAIARIEKFDPALNSIVTRTFERGRKQASQPVGSGPFAGVPFLVKDLEAVAGVRQTFGSAAFKSNVAPYTAEVILRMQRAGLIMLGKSNTPEFGLLPVTEPRGFGATHNPWNLAYSPGGSSGGSAAAVAAGLVPIASASDGGGSIRIPSSCCGLFGLKISRGRKPGVSRGERRRAVGDALRGPLGARQCGPVGRHARADDGRAVVCSAARASLFAGSRGAAGPAADCVYHQGFRWEPGAFPTVRRPSPRRPNCARSWGILSKRQFRSSTGDCSATRFACCGGRSRAGP